MIGIFGTSEPRLELVNEGESFTVPDDEVWVVDIIAGKDTGSTSQLIRLNGVDMPGGRDSWNPLQARKFLLVGGDQFSMPDGGDDGGATVSGFDVSNLIENDYLSIQLDEGEYTTLPEGDYRISMIAHKDTGNTSQLYEYDGEMIYGGRDLGYSTYTGGMEGGVEIGVPDNGDDGGIWLSGWRVDEHDV